MNPPLVGSLGFRVPSPSARWVGKLRFWPVALACVLLVGCGHTEQEWQWQLDKLTRAQAELAAAQGKLAQTEKESENDKSKVAEVTKAEGARSEDKAKAKVVEAMRGRYDVLRKKLEELAKQGVAVRVHKNRLTVSLPGDVLFESGRSDALKKEGQKLLQQVALVIKGEGSLSGRAWMVIGHTDNKKMQGGMYKDNVGVSAMKAREVREGIVTAGQLPPELWSAGGRGDLDPIASNETDDGKQKNRRVELVLEPNGDETIDLRAVAPESKPVTGP